MSRCTTLNVHGNLGTKGQDVVIQRGIDANESKLELLPQDREVWRMIRGRLDDNSNLHTDCNICRIPYSKSIRLILLTEDRVLTPTHVSTHR